MQQNPAMNKITFGSLWRKIKLQIHKIVFVFYRGNQYYCNCCKKSFRKFIAKGNPKRPNAKCPYCTSLERTRILDLYLENEIKIYTQKNISILHIGPEYGIQKKLMQAPSNYIDCDINAAMARYTIDIRTIPFPDQTFDIIICSNVLSHIREEDIALTELYRVLKHNGILLLQTYIPEHNNTTIEETNLINKKDRARIYGEPALWRLHGHDLGNKLEQFGFAVHKIDYRLQLSPSVLKTHSLGNGEREIIWKCTK